MRVLVKERPRRAVQTKQALENQRQRLFAKLHEVNQAIRKTNGETRKSEKLTLAKLRASLGWSRNQLAVLMNASDRAIVNWEAGDPMSPVYSSKLREIQSLYQELQHLMKPKEVGSWLLSE